MTIRKLFQTTFKKKTFFAFGAVLAGLFLALIAAEVILQAAWKGPWLPAPPGLLINDPDTGTAYAPNFTGYLNTPYYRVKIQTNSHGLRDGERPLQKPDGTYRILALGDSYAEGHGVEFEQSFLFKLEQLLKPPPGYERLDIVKAGIGGWGPVNEWQYLRTKGHLFQPDLVLVTFFMGNDFYDARHPFQYVAFDGIRLERSIAESMSPFRRVRIWLRKNVILYGVAVDGVRVLTGGGKAGPKGELTLLLNQCIVDRAIQTDALNETLANFQEWRSTEDIPVHFILLPHHALVETSSTMTLATELGYEQDALDLSKPGRVITELLDEHSLPYFDFTPALRNEANQRAVLNLGGDSHYNAGIHGLLARELTAYLDRQLNPD